MMCLLIIHATLMRFLKLCPMILFLVSICFMHLQTLISVTSLRDPVDNFESGFGFFRDFPYPQWLGDNPQIHKFLDDPRKYYDKTTPWHFRAKNYMAFDLGLEYESDDESYMNEAIKLTEHRFGLVMITDRFEESAILLKHELCMDVEDVAYLRLACIFLINSTIFKAQSTKRI